MANGSKAAPSAATTATWSGKVYQHWADGDAAKGTAAEWNNNILSDGKSDYFEGEVVPHAFIYAASNQAPLKNGQTYSFNVTYNHYQGNTNAGGFAFMTSPNVDRNPDGLGGNTLPDGNGFVNGGGMQGNFETLNADITAVSAVSYVKNGSGLDGVVTVTFKYTGPDTTNGFAEVNYGLLIAQPGQVPDQGKGATIGAHAWTGGSLQTTVDIGGSGATSLQLAPSAIIAGEISGLKFNDVNGDGARQPAGADGAAGTPDDEGPVAGVSIFLDNDHDGVLDSGEVSTTTRADGTYSLPVTPDADPATLANDGYCVREVVPGGWRQTTPNPAPIVIDALHPTASGVNFGNQQLLASFSMAKAASVPGGTANVLGELISYTITLTNTGNQTLTGVTVADPSVSNLQLLSEPQSADGVFNAGDVWHYSASRPVTQADIDAGGSIVNTATGDTDQTPPKTASASVPVAQNPDFTITKSASVPGGTADVAGEVISYTITLTNTGNQTLTGVTVVDPFVSNLQLVNDPQSADGVFNTGDVWHYSATHVVTQAELNADGSITNVATGDTDQTPPKNATVSVPVGQSPNFLIIKAASVPGGTANVVGELIRYTISMTNTGNIALTGVTVSDPSVSNLQLQVDPASGDGVLNVGETWQYTASRPVTQADIDADGNIINVASGDTNQTPPQTASASVPVQQDRQLAIVKTASVPGGTADVAGEVISYTLDVSNPGNTTLTGITVSDPFVGNLTLVADPASSDGILQPGETWRYLGSHAVTQAELDSGGNITNIATADSNQTNPVQDNASVPVAQKPALAIDKAFAGVTGGNGNGDADAPGDVLQYAITVYNRGNVTLDDIATNDAVTGLNASGLTLAPGASYTYNTSYTLTQGDLDNNGNNGGSGVILNTASAVSPQAPRATDFEAVPVVARPLLSFDKGVAFIDGGNGNAIADAAGDVIHYTLKLTNGGNVTLTNIHLEDPLTGYASDTASLAPGASLSFPTSYTLTQDDIYGNGNGTGYITNVANVASKQTALQQDGESTPIVRNAGLSLDKALVNITGGNGNAFADAPGDTLNYSFTVSNVGTVPLTNVQVTDPFTGFAGSVPLLLPGASQTLYASHVVTQAEIDSNKSGAILDTAYALSDQTPQTEDNSTVPLIRTPILVLNKAFLYVNGGNGNGVADAPNDQIHYAIAAFNPGNVTLKDVTVSDPLTGLNVTGLTLNPGDSVSYPTVYSLTQTDLDNNGNNGGNTGYIVNTATATSSETPTASSLHTVPLVRSIAMGLNESFVGVTGGNGNALADAPGDVLNFRFTVTNPGNITLTNLTLTDTLISINEPLASLAPNGSHTWNASYTLTQADLDVRGDGTGVLVNEASVTSTQAGLVTDGEQVSLVFDPRISLVKYVSVDNGANWVDSNVPPGPSLAAADAGQLRYKFSVTNTGNITLSGVELVDSAYDLNGPAPGNSYLFGAMVPGQTLDYVFTDTAFGLGPQQDLATATVVGLPAVTAIDNAYYTGVV